MSAAPADDGDEVAFVGELRRHAGAYERSPMANEARGKAREDGGVGGRFEPPLGGMIRVVESQADDFRRGRERRQVFDSATLERRTTRERAGGRSQGIAAADDQIRNGSGIFRIV